MKFLVIILSTCSLFISGCTGTGFGKKCTLMPDSISITASQARYREEAAAYRGFTIGAVWNLKY